MHLNYNYNVYKTAMNHWKVGKSLFIFSQVLSLTSLLANLFPIIWFNLFICVFILII